MIKDKNILLISPEPWGKCMVSKHHYAQHLAAMGNRVFFLAPASTEEVEIPYGVKILDPPKVPKGMRYFPAFWRLIQHRKIGKQLQEQAGAAFDIVWTFDTSVCFDLKEIAPKAVRILHVVDLSMEFEWKLAALSADICLGSSQRIKERLVKVNPNAHFIHHGYTKYPIVGNLLESDRPKIVYAGNLTIAYLDQSRLLSLVRNNSEYDFHFIGDRGNSNLSMGRTSEFLSELESLDNVILHDAVNPELLASYYASADALLICYNPIYREQISNPHKAMEYLGSGKPILSTWLEEYAEHQDLIFMTDDLTGYTEGLKQLLKEDDLDKQEKRKAFARNNTYLKQIEKIENLLKTLGS